MGNAYSEVLLHFHGTLVLSTQQDEVELVRHSLELLPTRPLAGRRGLEVAATPRRLGATERTSSRPLAQLAPLRQMMMGWRIRTAILEVGPLELPAHPGTRDTRPREAGAA